MNSNEAVSPVIAIVLMVILAALFPIIFYSFLGGIITPPEKSPYIAIESEIQEHEGIPYIEIRHRGGDTAYLNDTGMRRGSGINLFITRYGESIHANPDDVFSWGPGESLYMYNTPAGPRLTKDRAVALTGIGCLPGERSIIAVDMMAQMLVFKTNMIIHGIGPHPLLPPAPVPEAIELVGFTQTSITFKVHNPDGTPYNGSIPGAITLRERPGFALLNQEVVSSADAVWSPNINSNGIATLTYTNRDFNGVGTATVSPIIIESTDGVKVLRLQMLLQLNQDRIQEVVLIG